MKKSLSLQFGKFRLSIIRECTFKLDGGAMFGVVPKPLWNKVSPADDQNRILMACNLLLVETPTKRVLVETGMGSRWGEQEKDRYEIKPLVQDSNVLEAVGLRNEDIDCVIISHMHFDHIGGATRLVDGKLVPTFPKAKYYMQKGEWDFAHKANARAKASYRPDDFLPLKEHGVLEIIDGDSEVVPGVWARVTGGHTSHHQVVAFESDGNHGVYFADIIPTIAHLSPPWVMGYDHFPLTSCDIKSTWLARAAEEDWLVVFDHELGIPWGHVSLDAKGKFAFDPLAEDAKAFQSAKTKVVK